MKRIMCFIILALFFIPVIGNSKGEWSTSSEWYTTPPEIQDQDIPAYEPEEILNLDELDQSQTSSDSNYKVYNGFWAAQSFKTTKEKITRIQILMNRTEKRSFNLFKNIARKNVFYNLISKFIEHLGKFMDRRTISWEKIGNITVSIRINLKGIDIVSKSLSPDEIPKNTDAGWVEFDIPDITVTIGSTYYIVVRANGGNEKNYYNWRYVSSNRYSRGNAYTSSDYGSNWNSQNWDFAFKTYGEMIGEEPDGVVERWAVIVGISDYEGSGSSDAPYADSNALCMKNLLISHGWESDHIKILTNDEARKSNIESAIRWMDSKEDGDDIVLFYFSGHGHAGTAMITYPWNLFYASVLDEDLDRLGSKKMVLIFDSCFSGGFQNYLAQTGRVILMSAKITETSWWHSSIRSGVFTYFLAEGFSGSADSNHDGWVSAEEAFDYAAPLTTSRAVNPQHPQIYDGCPSISESKNFRKN